MCETFDTLIREKDERICISHIHAAQREREREKRSAPVWRIRNGKVEPTILNAVPFYDSTVGNAAVRAFAARIEGKTLRSDGAVNQNTLVIVILLLRLCSAAHVRKPNDCDNRRDGHREAQFKPHRRWQCCLVWCQCLSRDSDLYARTSGFNIRCH